jgi:hypothetical protein
VHLVPTCQFSPASAQSTGRSLDRAGRSHPWLPEFSSFSPGRTACGQFLPPLLHDRPTSYLAGCTPDAATAALVDDTEIGCSSFRACFNNKAASGVPRISIGKQCR